MNRIKSFFASIAVTLSLLLPFAAHADLSTEQRAAVLAAINADQTALSLAQAGNYAGVADWLNATAAPDFYVWRTSVTQDEIMQNGFDWVRVDNLSVGKARIWEWLFDNADNTINPAKANVRAAIDETWKGTAADLAVRAAVYLHCQRLATRLEKMFATGTGTAMPGGSPATMAVEGTIGWPEVKSIYTGA